MKTMFENAKFGDNFLTRDGRVAIFQYKDSTQAYLFTEDSYIHVDVTDGRANKTDDIVSTYMAPTIKIIGSKYEDATLPRNEDVVPRKLDEPTGKIYERTMTYVPTHNPDDFNRDERTKDDFLAYYPERPDSNNERIKHELILGFGKLIQY